MSIVNFNQILCKNLSDNGEDMTGIFDTLICERGKTRFFICVYFSQLTDESKDFDKYYYRIVLRFLGKNRTESKHYRVDNGFFWSQADMNNEIGDSRVAGHPSTRHGSSGRLSIGYSFDVEMQGNYEVDLYVKKCSEDSDSDSCEEKNVNDLDLVSIYPFQIIIQNP